MNSLQSMPTNKAKMAKSLRRKSSKTSKKKNYQPVVLCDRIPIFLRKTYNMIFSCDTSIASWSPDGLSFAIKDTEKFASDVIGQFFKHNNLSSFVRQLNFYGFRKVKSDRLRIEDEANDKHLRFRHENFRRGRPDLLKKIHKGNHNGEENAWKQEIESLKKEVKTLRSSMVTMSQELDKMAAIFINSAKTQGEEQGVTSGIFDPKEPLTKSQRILLEATPSSASGSIKIRMPQTNAQNRDNNISAVADEDDDAVACNIVVPSPVASSHFPSESCTSIAETSASDDFKGIVPDGPPSSAQRPGDKVMMSGYKNPEEFLPLAGIIDAYNYDILTRLDEEMLTSLFGSDGDI